MSSHKSLVALIIILAVVVGAIAIFSGQELLEPEEELSVEEKKSQILEQSAQADSKPLSAEEKADISKELGEGNSQQYRLTDEEKDAILKALNKN